MLSKEEAIGRVKNEVAEQIKRKLEEQKEIEKLEGANLKLLENLVSEMQSGDTDTSEVIFAWTKCVTPAELI